MRYLKSVVLYASICCFALFTACHSSEDDPQPAPPVEPKPEVILTLTIDAAYVGYSSTDEWVFAHDESGELLDIKSYTPGQTVTLSTTKKVDKFTLTFFDVSTLWKFKIFSTFANVSKGTALKFSPQPTARTDGHNVVFHLSDYPYAEPVWNVRFSNGFNYSTMGNDKGDGSWDITGQVFDDAPDFLISGYHDGLPVYHWEKGLKANDKVELDYNTFDAYPNLITLDAPGKNNGTIWGNRGNKSFYFCDTYSDGDPDHESDTPTLGYLDGFDSYFEEVINETDKSSVFYFKTGTINKAVEFPAFAFTLHSSEMKNWSSEFSLDYTALSVNWTYDVAATGDHVSWTFTAPPNQSISVPAIPPAIATKYPEIALDKFKYQQCHFDKYLDGRTYADQVLGAPAKNLISSEYYTIYPLKQ